MTPRISGFETRAIVGLVAPRSRSFNVNPTGPSGGSTLHYAGAAQIVRNHADCRALWRGYQRFHMISRNWVDIAYNDGVCQHGYVLAGRGWGVRSAANGSNTGNFVTLATCAILGGSQQPSQAMIDAIAWVVWERRRLGSGLRVYPHSNWTDTLCPGSSLRLIAASLDRIPVGPRVEETPVGTVSKYAEADWAKARREGIVTDQSNPRGNLITQDFVVMIGRTGLLDSPRTVPGWAQPTVDKAYNDDVIKRGTATQIMRRYDHLVLAGR